MLPSLTTRLVTIRASRFLRAVIVAGAVLCLACASGGNGQEAAARGAPVPDHDAAVLSHWQPPAGQRCVAVDTPRVLPSPTQLLDTMALDVYLDQVGVARDTGSLLLALRFDSAGTMRHAWVIESDLADSTAAQATRAVVAALRPQPLGMPWGMRVRLDLGGPEGPAPRLRVGRSERCQPAPRPPRGGMPYYRVETRGAQVTSRDLEWRAIVSADGNLLDLLLLTPPGSRDIDQEMARWIEERLRTDKWLPGLEDRVPTTMVTIYTAHTETRVIARPAGARLP